MKKLLAILLSVLMLCTMIPFAAVSVSADDEYYIELVADAEEVNAGDEVTVEVSLYGHESVGLIGLQLELLFDSDVFELVTYYDEDEEMWMPPIEVGPKFSASSNKYILFSPIDEETGYMERCLVQFLRSTASASQAVKTNLFYTVTFKVKDDAPSGTYELIPDGYQGGNTVAYGNDPLGDLFSVENLSITVNGSEPSCEHENTYTLYTYGSDNGLHKVIVTCEACGETVNSYEEPCSGGTATCTECATCEKCGLNYGDTLPHEYFSACDTVCMICGEETRPEAAHNVIHVEALEPTCTEIGNIEYWYCDVCGAAWLDAECTMNTNLMAVKLGASCKYSAEHVAAKEANCFEEGNTEYWYCANCDVYYADADCTIVTNRLNTVIPVSHNVIHVEAVDPTCAENGNIEYWYCDICGQAWLDELCHLNTNLRAVVLPATGEHTYDGEYDAECNVCGEIREIASPITCIGKAVSEDVSGLAFLFEADVIMVKPETNKAVYGGDTKIVINGVEYGLKKMGALISLNADMSNSSKVVANNLYNWEENAVQFAVRVKNIPETNLDTVIYAQDYYVLDNGVTIYGDIVSGSYNGVLNAQ